MIIKAIHLYTYKQPFKSPIITPKVKLYERESLIVVILTRDNQSFYGECNAYDYGDREHHFLSLLKYIIVITSE